jgi:hypothetical protein
MENTGKFMEFQKIFIHLLVSLGIFPVAPPDGTMCPGVDATPENEYQAFLLR